LDPIRGYLQLAEALFSQNRQAAAAWNFGPGPKGEIQVLRIVERAKEYFPELTWRIEAPPFEEANLLAIDSTKAETGLKWSPLLTTAEAIDWTFPGTRTPSVGKRRKTDRQSHRKILCPSAARGAVMSRKTYAILRAFDDQLTEILEQGARTLR
jgi:hypothetical protein